jgi:hypothetical protein
MTEEPDRLDAPNQQVVRADGSGPGHDSAAGEPKKKPPKKAAEDEEAPGR